MERYIPLDRERIGEGTYGVVYKVFDTINKEELAQK